MMVVEVALLLSICGRRCSSAVPPFAVPPLPHQRVMRQVELERRDGDVAVAEVRDVGVFLGRPEREDAAVPVVSLPARAFAFLVRIDPWPRALAANFDA